MRTYTAAIIDDYAGDLKLLSLLLNKYCPNIEIIATGSSIKEGVEIYYTHKPDILFLDILLDGDNSFTLLDYIDEIDSEIIFVSSFDGYALKAIGYGASGYIVKPVNPKNLVETVKRIIAKISKTNLTDKKQENDFIAIPLPKSIEIIQTSTIIHLEADGRYTVFHFKDRSKMMASKNIGEYETLLDPNTFVRIHHKYIVNLSMVKSINKAAGNYCEMTNDVSLPVSKRKLENLQRILKLK